MPFSVQEYLERGPATSREIQAATGLNQKAVSRHIQSMGSNVIRLRQGRTHLYAVTTNAFGANDKLPLFMVDIHGNNTMVATIRPLAHGGFFISDASGISPLLLGRNKDGLFDDLPYFLLDLSPQGFIGRQIAKEMANQSDNFPSDPRYWNTNNIGCYLLSNGDNLPGNFKFGTQSGLRRKQEATATKRNEYPKLADEIISGEVGGSSAGGEQPKFTTYCHERLAHVIVKFSPKGESELARRWRDVLVTEYHATKALQNAGLSAAETELFEIGSRLFLESVRFDRIGEYGRTSMISLLSVDAEFIGSGGNWPEVINTLVDQDLIGTRHSIEAKILWAFGRLINNTDMHLGNLSLSVEGNIFGLCPIYDMCSMGFSPKSSGEIAPIEFKVPTITARIINENEYLKAKTCAHDFWNRVNGDERISEEFRAFLEKGNPVTSSE